MNPLDLDMDPQAQLVDAATVYAEGYLAGVRTAVNMITGHSAYWVCPQCTANNKAGTDKSLIKRLMHHITEWRSRVYHNQWLAQQGRPAGMPELPDREATFKRLRAFMLMHPETDHAD